MNKMKKSYFIARTKHKLHCNPDLKKNLTKGENK